MGQCGTKCAQALVGGNGSCDVELDEEMGRPKWQRVRRNSMEEDDDGSPRSEVSVLRDRLRQYEDAAFLRSENKKLLEKVRRLEDELSLARGEDPATRPSKSVDNCGSPPPSPPLIDIGTPESARKEHEESDEEEEEEQDEIRRAVKQSAAKLCKLSRTEENWKLMKAKQGISLWSCEIPGSNALGVKVRSILQYPAEIVFEVLMDPSTQFDKSTTYEVIEELGDNFRIAYTRVPIPLFSDQDFCCAEWSGKKKSDFIYSFKSVTHPSCVPNRKCVRGNVEAGGWHVHPLDATSCEATMINICDPCRSVPKALATSTADKSGKSILTLRKLCQKHVERRGTS